LSLQSLAKKDMLKKEVIPLTHIIMKA